MASHKSAVKQVAKDRRRRARNRGSRSALRTVLKSVRTAIDSKDASTVQSQLGRAVSLLDRTASKGVMHRNAAARTKSRLARQARKATSKG
jgi:small subunit ribosomal protein S20